jgi:hypothetical protein
MEEQREKQLSKVIEIFVGIKITCNNICLITKNICRKHLSLSFGIISLDMKALEYFCLLQDRGCIHIYYTNNKGFSVKSYTPNETVKVCQID